MSLTSSIADIFTPGIQLPNGVSIKFNGATQPYNAVAIREHIVKQLTAVDENNNPIPDLNPAIFEFNQWHIELDNTSLNTLINVEFKTVDDLISQLPEDTDKKKQLKEQLCAIINANKLLILQQMYVDYLNAATSEAKQAILNQPSHITNMPEFQLVSLQVSDFITKYQSLADAKECDNKEDRASKVYTSLDDLCKSAETTYTPKSADKKPATAATHIKKALKIIAWVAIPVLIFGLVGAVVGAAGVAGTSAALAEGATGTATVSTAAVKAAAILGAKTGAGLGLLDGIYSFWENGCRAPTRTQLKQKFRDDIGRGTKQVLREFVPNFEPEKSNAAMA